MSLISSNYGRKDLSLKNETGDTDQQYGEDESDNEGGDNHHDVNHE